jgi:hypothetical protein
LVAVETGRSQVAPTGSAPPTAKPKNYSSALAAKLLGGAHDPADLPTDCELRRSANKNGKLARHIVVSLQTSFMRCYGSPSSQEMTH